MKKLCPLRVILKQKILKLNKYHFYDIHNLVYACKPNNYSYLTTM